MRPGRRPAGRRSTVTATQHDTHDAIATVWRLESARVVAAVARLTHDLGVAEELAGDALIAALEHWPRDGVPANPGAWLTTVARRRALDHLRHRAMAAAEHDALARDDEARGTVFVPSVMDTLIATEADPVGDDLLRLIFTACHPVLSTEARVALTLRLLGGLSTAEIARAFLSSEATVAQRTVRAKRALAEAQVPFEVPQAAERTRRLRRISGSKALIIRLEGQPFTTTAVPCIASKRFSS